MHNAIAASASKERHHAGPGARARRARFAWEIAADQSHPVVRSVSFLLTGFWNKIYDGVQMHHFDKLRAIAPGHEIIYVPCHRSHIDYLLLSYLLYRNGVVVPHIAAGVNLNLPVIGPMLRRGGAFFMRRSFKGNALYSTVFTRIREPAVRARRLDRIFHRGRPLAHRPPAGAARRHAVDDAAQLPARVAPAGRVPAGLHRLRKADGRRIPTSASCPARPKEKESLLGLLRAFSMLRKHYGKVAVNFGEPILLDRLLDEVDAGLARRDRRSRTPSRRG